MMNDTNRHRCSWLAGVVIAVLATHANATEVSPQELATLGMRMILQQDDDSFVQFQAHVAGSTEQDMRGESLDEFRKELDGNMAAAVERARGGHSLYQVMTEALGRISCDLVLPGKAAERNPDGSETIIVLMRCNYPEIRHIEVGAPSDTSEGELIPGTNRSWKSYLEDLRRPATVAVDFEWGLMRDASRGLPRWTPYPLVLEIIQMKAYLAISPVSLPGGTVNSINAIQDRAAANDDVAPRNPEDE